MNFFGNLKRLAFATAIAFFAMGATGQVSAATVSGQSFLQFTSISFSQTAGLFIGTSEVRAVDNTGLILSNDDGGAANGILIDDSGRVGINTADPSHQFSVDANTQVTGTLDVTSTVTLDSTLDVSGAMTASSIDASGIITAADLVVDADVDIGGNIDTVGAITATGAISAASFSGDGSSLTGLAAGATITDADSDTKIQSEESGDEDILRFDTAGSQRMTITETGLVAIGSVSPAAGTSFAVDGDTLLNGDLTVTDITANEIAGTLTTVTQANVTDIGTQTSADIDGGAIDGTAIGAGTAAAGNFTTLDATGDITGTIATASQQGINDIGTQSSADIDGGFIDGTPIGQTSASNAKFGIVTATTANFTTINGTINTAAQLTITSVGSMARVTATDVDATNINATNLTGTLQTAAQLNITSVGSMTRVTATNGDFTNVNGTLQTAAQPNVTSLGTITSLVATTADINGGSIDGATIGGSTAGAGNFTTLDATGDITGTLATASQTNITALGTITSLVATTADINGGSIDGATIGGSTAGAGNFTTLDATGSITGTLGTAAQGNITSLGTLTSLVADTADINGGTFDGVVGGTTPAAGTFTAVVGTSISVPWTEYSTNFSPSAGVLAMVATDELSASLNATLPVAPTTGEAFEIFDTGRTAGTYNIVIVPGSGNTINGSGDSIAIDYNRGRALCVANDADDYTCWLN